MARKKRRFKGGDAQLPIAAMIDIVFLLIIFFVICASMEKEIEDEAVILANAPHGKPVIKKDPRSVVINVREKGSVYISNQIVSMSQVSAILTNAAARWGINIPIVIRGDKNTQHGYIKKVMEAVTDTRLYRIKFSAVVEEAKE